MIMNNIKKSIDVVIKSNDKVLAGQQNATFSQQTATSEITNKIQLDWKRFLPGVRGWQINCNGLYVMSEETLRVLEHSYLEGEPVSVSLTIDGANYSGECLITAFPMQATFNKGLAYTLTLLGSGPLQRAE